MPYSLQSFIFCNVDSSFFLLALICFLIFTWLYQLLMFRNCYSFLMGKIKSPILFDYIISLRQVEYMLLCKQIELFALDLCSMIILCACLCHISYIPQLSILYSLFKILSVLILAKQTSFYIFEISLKKSQELHLRCRPFQVDYSR